MRTRSILLMLLFVLIAVPVGLMVWPDQPLRPQVVRALESPERLPARRNLFNHLAALAVAVDRDPAQTTYDAVTRVNELLAAAPAGDTDALGAQVLAAWVKQELSLEDAGEVLCSPREPGCVARLWASREAVEALAVAHPVMTGRYLEASSASAHQMELAAHVAMPFPDFQPLLETHRLLLGLWLVEYLNGDGTAVARLSADIRFLRRYLAQADYLLGKMVAATMLVEDLHVQAAMMDGGPQAGQAFEALAGLTDAERSMQPSLDSEFRFNAQAVMSIAMDPEMRGHELVPEWVGSAVLRPLFKPRRSINQTFLCFQDVAAVTRLSAAQYLLLASQPDSASCRPRWSDWIMNPIGTILLEVARPALGQYAARLHDLNGLITLVNLKRAIRVAGVEPAGLEAFVSQAGHLDPYTGKPMQWDADRGTLRFTSPHPAPGYNELPMYPLEADARG